MLWKTILRPSGDQSGAWSGVGWLVAGSRRAGALPFGLAVSTIATAASPRPYRTRIGEDVNENNFVQDDWIDGKRYRVPENAWRSWYRMVDVRLTKAIDLGRVGRLLVIAEAFNVTNRRNWIFPNTFVSGAPVNPTGAEIAREVQLGIRVVF